MTSLIATSAFELKDDRVLDIINGRPDIEIFKNIHGAITGSWLVDRTEQIKLPFRTCLLEKYKIPNFKDLEKRELIDYCILRAKDILSRNKKILFLWSGGIDSTAALISFILAGADRNQLTVVCNLDSIRENNDFFNNHIKKKFNLMSSEFFMQKIKFSDIIDIVVSSEHGDCMHGQDFGMSMLSLFGPEYLEKFITKDNVIDFLKKCNLDDVSANCWYDIFNSTMDQSPRSLITMYDYSWWVGYNWRWQWAGEKIHLRIPNNVDIETFYSTDELQYWSVNHKQNKIFKLSDFKIDLKKIIYDFDKNKNYFFNKIKHTSITFYYGGDSFAAIDEKFNKIKSKNFSILDYYQPDNFIRQWLS